MKRFYWLVLFVVLSGCAGFGLINMDKLYGPATADDHMAATVPVNHVDYWTDVQPILNDRCVVCHACYDAPCQLKTTAIEGLERGGTKQRVYKSSRLTPAEPTRLFEDALSTQQWRDKGFYPVLNEHSDSLESNREASLLYKLLELKEKHPLPAGKLLPEDFTLGYDRTEVCPAPEEMNNFVKSNPLWGMPYGLPKLDNLEQTKLKMWLEQGANYTPRPALSKEYKTEIAKWEAFLNGDSLKQQLVNRYIYEHLFLANLYFGELSTSDKAPQFFKLVRSSTPPGEPVQLIVTRRPYDDPKIQRVYYRIVPQLETIVVKTHLPYVLNQARMQRWDSLFYKEDYKVSGLPAYTPKIAANPFITFEQLPMVSRYKFMLDEAQFTIMNFIKGPVCRGQVAVNVIRDHFWVFFVDPDLPTNDELDELIELNAEELALPSAEGSIYTPISTWNNYSERAKKRAKAKQEFLIEVFAKNQSTQDVKLDQNLIWDGVMPDGSHNQNAALTVFRHFDSASVHQGLLGESPQTAWIISYPLLEQIYYLLVAGYDVYGNLGHQVMSRLYMDFLRMDGEANFLEYLPKEAKQQEVENWYRNADPKILSYLNSPELNKLVKPEIIYQTDNPKLELYALIKERLGQSVSQQYSLENITNSSLRASLKQLSDFKGEATQFLPEISVIEIIDAKGKSTYVTLLKNNAHLNVTSLFSENKNLIIEENTVTVAYGVVGSYPNVFMRVNQYDLDHLTKLLISMKSNDDYMKALDFYGVRRTDNRFWDYSDRLHENLYKSDPKEFGYLDYNRLENR